MHRLILITLLFPTLAIAKDLRGQWVSAGSACIDLVKGDGFFVVTLSQASSVSCPIVNSPDGSVLINRVSVPALSDPIRFRFGEYLAQTALIERLNDPENHGSRILEVIYIQAPTS